MIFVLGIDPGLDGALVLVNEMGAEVMRHKMPLIELEKKKKKGQKKAGKMRIIDEEALVRIVDEILKFTEGSDLCAYLEKVSAMPGQGVSTMFKLGENYGIMKGVLAGKIRTTLVHPATWTKVMHAGVPGGLKSKAASLYVIKREYPNECFLRSSACKVFDDGLMDGRLVAEYGRRQEVSRRLT